jgi:hypothetical protein
MAKDTYPVEVTRKVKIITPKAKYTNHPYHYAIPVSVSSRKPVTGQQDIVVWTLERIPRANGGEDRVWKSEKGEGRAPFSADEKNKLQMGKTPYIINPNNEIIIIHGHTYDDSYTLTMGKVEGEPDRQIDKEYKNPQDHAEFTALISGSESTVALNKTVYIKSKHNFYVEDKDAEAQVGIEKMDLAYEAEQFVRNDFKSGRWPEIVRFISYSVPDVRKDPKMMSDTQIRHFILNACKEYPAEVLKMKGVDSKIIIFILQLTARNIITRGRNMDFYYNDENIGSTIDAVKDWMRDKRNNGIVSKWQHQLDYEEKKQVEVSEPATT